MESSYISRGMNLGLCLREGPNPLALFSLGKCNGSRCAGTFVLVPLYHSQSEQFLHSLSFLASCGFLYPIFLYFFIFVTNGSGQDRILISAFNCRMTYEYDYFSYSGLFKMSHCLLPIFFNLNFEFEITKIL